MAVKYFKAHARSSDVKHEAKMIMRFDHPGTIFSLLSPLGRAYFSRPIRGSGLI